MLMEYTLVLPSFGVTLNMVYPGTWPQWHSTKEILSGKKHGKIMVFVIKDSKFTKYHATITASKTS
jgi:hypothetical protein